MTSMQSLILSREIVALDLGVWSNAYVIQQPAKARFGGDSYLLVYRC